MGDVEHFISDSGRANILVTRSSTVDKKEKSVNNANRNNLTDQRITPMFCLNCGRIKLFVLSAGVRSPPPPLIDKYAFCGLIDTIFWEDSLTEGFLPNWFLDCS